MPLYLQNTMHKSASPAASLNERIAQARSQLQQIPECDPEFERQLLHLIRLVDERDAHQPPPHAHSKGCGYRLA